MKLNTLSTNVQPFVTRPMNLPVFLHAFDYQEYSVLCLEYLHVQCLTSQQLVAVQLSLWWTRQPDWTGQAWSLWPPRLLKVRKFISLVCSIIVHVINILRQ